MRKNPIKKEDVLKIYTDGAARDNPGPGACAFIFVKGEDVIYSDSKYLGTVTNNKAEYNAVIEALKKAVEYTRWNVRVYSDSVLIINQINGEWRIKKGHLKELYDEVMLYKGRFDNVGFFQVGRTNRFIKKADKLCNRCLDENSSS
jgi:ribonuclease HI